ncbi:MAG TPA: polymorphic toxin type 30 domain-containing protein, partial [Candidatus Obscuribacterales bacterium]
MANIGSTGPSRPLPSVGSPPVSPPLVTTPSTPPTPPSTPPLTPPRTGSGPPTIGSGTDQTGVQSSISSQSSGQISHTSSSVPVPSSLEVEDTRPVDFTSLLTSSGRLSHEELMTMVPSGIRDTFVPSSRIDRGSKYRWTDGTNYYEVKFHSSDRGAPRGSNSATGWT